MKSKLYQVILFCCIIVSLGSCSKNYLNVSDELAGQLTLDQIFTNPGNTRSFHRNIFAGIGISSAMSFTTAGASPRGVDNPWPAFTDEIRNQQGAFRLEPPAGFNSSNPPFSRWDLYLYIRQANIFMANAKIIPRLGGTSASGAVADAIEEPEFKKLMAQAKFLRAYYHYLLFELYGPVPIMFKIFNPDDADLDFERNSVDEVVNFVTQEMDAAAIDLDEYIPLTDINNLALPTKGVALAIKAKMLVLAASPLYNGGFTEGLALSNKDGKRLFPAKDDSKWQKALTALQDFINFSVGKYALYNEYTGGVLDPDKSIYQLFQAMNSEVIWANSNESYGSISAGDGTVRRSTPKSQGGIGSTGVTQEVVDAFFMKNGKSINDPGSGYSETGFSTVTEVPAGRSEAGTFNMYVNREPRFYASIVYHGKRWPVTNAIIKFTVGSGNEFGANYTMSGYYMYKRLNRTVSQSVSSAPKAFYRPSFIFRLAEFYLLYAEALNEVNSSDPKIAQYVDLIRERAGVPKWSVSNPEIVGNQELQREAIRKESRVELCFEGQRYFDVRRWMIAERPSGQGAQGGPFYGMNMGGVTTDADFLKRTQYETRVFTRAYYLWPFPLVEIQKSRKLVQNPGW
jgi:hypothetical protein